MCRQSLWSVQGIYNVTSSSVSCSLTSWKQAACSPLLDFLVSGEVFNIKDSSDKDTLDFCLFGVSSIVLAIKNRRAIELKAGSSRNTSHSAISLLKKVSGGGGGSSVFEPLVRGGLFNFQLPMGGSSCFLTGIATHLTQSTTEVTSSSSKGQKQFEPWLKKYT